MSDSSLKKGRFTKFSNRIGLYSNQTGNYIANTPEVVLNFPFKDTVLEGGMTKEDVGRDERFLHLEIDKKDIDTLEDPKVLTNFKFIDESGETELGSTSDIQFFDEKGDLKQNLLIKGNNLLALHSLKERFAGKIKLIYIDPPYNTGSDSFHYNDHFNHSSWLVFMKNRLEVARELLADDGSIFVQIDQNEAAYLKVLMDEVFGRENYLNEIIWWYKNGGGRSNSWFNRKHDNIYWYSKKPESYTFNPKEAGEKRNLDEGSFGGYFKTDENGRRYQEVRANGKVYKYYTDELKNADDVWEMSIISQRDKTERSSGFSGQKPERLIERIIKAASNEGDIVLDYHLGTGTTAKVALKLGRKFIGVEQMDYIDTLTKPRIKETINGEQGGISKDVNWQGGGSFVYMELKKYNQDFLDRLMEVTSISDVEAVYEDMQKNAFLKFFFDKKEFEKDENFRSKTWEERRDMLVEILDENQLYLNLQDMRDSKHKVSNDEMVLTDRFYGVNEDAES